MKPRVVFQTDAHGNVSVYADPDVEVIMCCDWVPNDRLYRMEPEPIPDGLLSGSIGHRGDGHPGETRITRAVREATGQDPFDVVSSDDTAP